MNVESAVMALFALDGEAKAGADYNVFDLYVIRLSDGVNDGSCDVF